MSVPAREAVQRHTLRVLVAAQGVGAVGFTAGITVGALLGEEMIGDRRYSGLPAGLFTLGSALAALAVAELAQGRGRRISLGGGFAAGAAGGAGTVVAAAVGCVPLLLVALFVYGAGVATTLQARYAGADLATEDHRGRAIGVVLLATTVGSLVGPNLVAPAGRLAEAVDVPRLAGPFLLAAAAYGAAALVVLGLLRPDPLLLARRLSVAADGASTPRAPAPPTRDQVQGVATGAAVLLVAQLVMLGVMTMTPVHMHDHGQGDAATGLVVSLHIGAMFLPSPVSGRLTDRMGPAVSIGAGALTLAMAGLGSAAAPAGSAAGLAIALVLLGVGWNLCIVGGTAVVTASVPVDRRARAQGAADVGLALAGAAGAFGSGLVVSASGFATLSLMGAAMTLTLVPVVVALSRRRRPVGSPAAGG